MPLNERSGHAVTLSYTTGLSNARSNFATFIAAALANDVAPHRY